MPRIWQPAPKQPSPRRGNRLRAEATVSAPNLARRSRPLPLPPRSRFASAFDAEAEYMTRCALAMPIISASTGRLIGVCEARASHLRARLTRNREAAPPESAPRVLPLQRRQQQVHPAVVCTPIGMSS
eukprot:52403-Pleurochrysis_carterae.AAC.3